MSKQKNFYMNRKPRTKPCAESNKTPKVPVPLTQDGIDRLGGVDRATKDISRYLGYPVKIKTV